MEGAMRGWERRRKVNKMEKERKEQGLPPKKFNTKEALAEAGAKALYNLTVTTLSGGLIRPHDSDGS